MSEIISLGLHKLLWNDTTLGNIHNDSSIELVESPVVKQYFKKGSELPVKEEILEYRQELTVGLVYSDEKETLFKGLGAHEGTLKIEGEYTKIIDNMSAIADFNSIYTEEGTKIINVKFSKLKK